MTTRAQRFEQAHGWISYPFPLSDGTLAEVRIPFGNLTADDAERLAAFVDALSVEFSPKAAFGETA